MQPSSSSFSAPSTPPSAPLYAPSPARFSPAIWYYLRLHAGHFHLDNIALHRDYDSAMSINDPAALKQIYSLGQGFPKSDWYTAWSPTAARSLFSAQDQKAHSAMRRKFQATYSMSSLVKYEAFVDTCTALFRKHLAERAGDGTEMDLAWWMNCYATDTVAMISSSQRLGDLDAGEDVGDLAKTLHGGLAYVSLVGIFAEWHLPLMNLMAHLRALGLTKGSPRMIVNDFVLRVMGERRQHRAAREKVHADLATAAADETTPRDMLDKFLDFHENAPDHFTDTDISVGLSANVVAGADTTAASLSAVLYYLLKNPRTFLRLRADLDAGTAAGTLSSPVTFKQAQDLPYLQAVVQEALRLHPAVGLPLERVVPPPGAELCGRWFPLTP
ncbi:hypothetical protein LTR87_013036 [Friedmanniomyces endolithicus]|nr:hypothetical protein LTR87_013036 [Friedmanniomyces endolithicus]